MQEKYKYAEFSLQFLKITKVILEENIKRNNTQSTELVSMSKTDFEDYFYDVTKYSDYSIWIPLIYNFYHGVELCLKNIIFLTTNNISKTHDLEELYRNINWIKDLKVLEKYIFTEKMENKILKLFFSEISPKDFYIYLRYPEVDVSELVWQEEKILDFYKELEKDIEFLIKFIVSYTREEAIISK